MEDIFQYYSGKGVLKLPVLLLLHQSLISPGAQFIQEQTNPSPFYFLPNTQYKY